MSNIFLYDRASSIGVKFFLWIFSISAISALSLSFKFLIITGTVSLPARTLALYLLSPAIISYLSPIVLTTKGWITPCSFIESDNSNISSSSNWILGWNLFGKISLISTSITLYELSFILSLLILQI